MEVRFVSAADYRSASAVRAAYPSVSRIVTVYGGWLLFQSERAYRLWRRAK